MLNPPLSNLSHELLALVVEDLADDFDYFAPKHLKRLSVADRAITAMCQAHLFKKLVVDGSNKHMIKSLQTAHDILKARESSSVSFVRCICIMLDEQRDVTWLFQDKTFISLMRVLSKAPRPPYELELFSKNSPMTKNPNLPMEGLLSSCFSASLELLMIWNPCQHPPHLPRSPACRVM